MHTKGVNRAATAWCGFGKFCAYQPRRVTSKSVKPCQRRLDVHLVMIFAKRRDFSEVTVLDNKSCFCCLSNSFYLRFRDASGRKFVGTILLLVFLQMACCGHCSDALACELLIQNSGQLSGRHLTRKMLSGLQVQRFVYYPFFCIM